MTETPDSAEKASNSMQDKNNESGARPEEPTPASDPGAPVRIPLNVEDNSTPDSPCLCSCDCNSDESEPKVGDEQGEYTGVQECGSSCDCTPKRSGTKVKWIVTIAVVVIAGLLLAINTMNKPKNGSTAGKGLFGAGIFGGKKAVANPASNQDRDSNAVAQWRNELPSLLALNDRAADKNAVLLYLVPVEQEPNDSTERVIEKVAATLKAGGLETAYFLLDKTSADYTMISAQTPMPCVLAMVKGGGMMPVSGNITEGSLLQAIVTASRPQGGGCGPSSADCAPGASCP